MSNKKLFQEILNENWQAVCGMLLGREPQIVFSAVEDVDKEMAVDGITRMQLALKLFYSEDEKDYLFLGVNNALVSMIANLMMGIETFSEDVGSDDLDAFAEAVNQLFSACQVPIMEKTGESTKFGGISYLKAEELKGIILDEPLLLWNIDVDIPGIGRSDFIMVSPRRFVAGPVDPARAGESPVIGKKKEVPGKLKTNETNIDLLLDVELPITVRIGSTEMKLVDIMRLGIGSIIELEKMVDDPVDVLVNAKLVAKGEVVVYNGNFAIRIIEVQSREARIRSLSD